MRGLAELAMRSPRSAILLSILCIAIPMLSWLGAAIIALSILRCGTKAGLTVLFWAILPAIAWAAIGQYTVFTSLIVTVILAIILRQYSWNIVLLGLIPLGLLVAVLLAFIESSQIITITALITKMFTPVIADAQRSGLLAANSNTHSIIYYFVIALMSWLNMVGSIIGVVLARYWQACLYNPQGFAKEFIKIKFEPAISVALIVLLIAGVSFSFKLITISLIVSLPLSIAGIALIHGLAVHIKHGKFWFIIFYGLLIIFTQLMYPILLLLAFLDSLFDFRYRMQK